MYFLDQSRTRLRTPLREMRGAPVQIDRKGSVVYVDFGGFRRTFDADNTVDHVIYEYGPIINAGRIDGDADSTLGYLRQSVTSPDDVTIGFNPMLVGSFGNWQFCEALCYWNLASDTTSVFGGPGVFTYGEDGSSTDRTGYQYLVARAGGSEFEVRLYRRNGSGVYTLLGTDYLESKNYGQKLFHLAAEARDFGTNTVVKCWFNGRQTHNYSDTAASRIRHNANTTTYTGLISSVPGIAYGNGGAGDQNKWIIKMRGGTGPYQPEHDRGYEWRSLLAGTSQNIIEVPMGPPR